MFSNILCQKTIILNDFQTLSIKIIGYMRQLLLKKFSNKQIIIIVNLK